MLHMDTVNDYSFCNIFSHFNTNVEQVRINIKYFKQVPSKYVYYYYIV